MDEEDFIHINLTPAKRGFIAKSTKREMAYRKILLRRVRCKDVEAILELRNKYNAKIFWPEKAK